MLLLPATVKKSLASSIHLVARLSHMAVSIEEFCEQVSRLGVISEQELSSFRNELSVVQPGSDVKDLARSLVRRKDLTGFQAQQIYNGKGTARILGNYLILDKLGQGGMGSVLKAVHRRMNRIVAVKVLTPSLVRSPLSLARFHREIKAIAQLQHPNIVTAYDADEANGMHFLVMQYVDGDDLASLVKSNGPLSLPDAVQLISQAAQGLAYAHQQGVVHRDIKPANLLINRNGLVQVLDLGLARFQSESSAVDDQLTQSGQIMGTVDYMAPEQAKNTRDADARADIYSLGATFWYLVTAQAMYTGENMVQKLMAHQNSPLRNFKQARPEASPMLVRWWRRTVSKSPQNRQQSMVEVIEELNQCDESSGATLSPHKFSTPSTFKSLTKEPSKSGTVPANQSLTNTSVAARPSSRVAMFSNTVVNKNALLTSKKRIPYHWIIVATLSLLGLLVGSVVFLSPKRSTQPNSLVPEIPMATSQPIPASPQPMATFSNTTTTQASDPIPEPVSPEPVSPEPVSPEPMANLSNAPNREETSEKTAPWRMLFDGSDASEWSILGPYHIEDGLLVARGGRSNAISKSQYSNFELEATWRIGRGANGGIKYRTEATTEIKSGNEYQIADQESNPTEYPPVNQTGSLYGLLAPTSDVMYPVGQWNTTRIVCQGSNIEHWLNDVLLLSYDTSSEKFRQLVDGSRFKGQISHQPSGYLLLQSISGECVFKSIRIRVIDN